MENIETYRVIATVNEKEYILAKGLDFKDALLLIQQSKNDYDSLNISQDYIVEDKPENFLVLSDTKMMLTETKMLLDRPEKFNEQLIFLGNFIDKGKGFYDYMSYLVELNKERDCVFVKGKNEYNLMEYINQTFRYVGPEREVNEMISSIEKELSFPVSTLASTFSDFYQLIASAVDYYENDYYIFVSGGLDLELDSWKHSAPEELFTTTESFLRVKNHTTKKIVFGGMPLSYLNRSPIITPFFNRTEDKIGINGDCKQGGKLLGLFIHNNVQSFMGIRNIEKREELSRKRKQLLAEN